MSHFCANTCVSASFGFGDFFWLHVKVQASVLYHESFCLDNEEEKYNPHQKGHCTVKEASITAQTLKVQNLIILHTEDNDLKNRKKLYTSESKKYFNGNVYVPNDLDIIEI